MNGHFYKIEESTGRGYIVLEGIFTTREAAEAAISRHRNNENMRAALYCTGRWSGGAIRADEVM